MSFKFYKKAIVIPSVFALVANIIYSIVYIRLSNYKSEWLTTDFIAQSMLLMGILNSAVIALLSLPIFLNNYPAVKNNTLLRMLSWFLLPAIWHIFIFSSSMPSHSALEDGIENPAIFAAINTVPYIIGTSIAYVHFSKQCRLDQTSKG